MQFREHRSTVTESMETMVTLPDREALIRHIQERLPEHCRSSASQITVAPYYKTLDARTGWEKTYMVTIPEGIVGFTDAPC